MGKTKKTPRTALPSGIGKVLKRLHYPLDVILLCVRWYVGSSRQGCQTLSRDHVALEVGTSSWLANQRERGVCRSVLKLRRESGKAHEGQPGSEPDWGNPTVRDRRGACGIVVSTGAGLSPSGKLLDRPPDPAVMCAPHFYPDRTR